MRQETRQETVRLSFDVPLKEHAALKSECAQARIPIKEFLHEWMLKGLQELKKAKFKEELREAIQQSKEGKTKYRDVSRFAEFVDE
jgi:hypothetical protein